MNRAACAGAIAVALGGCGFAVRNPAPTAAIVSGTLALTTCELASDDHSSCLLAGGAAAAFLGLIAAGALWLGSSDEPSVMMEPDPVPPIRPAQQRPAIAPAAATAPAAPLVIPPYLQQPPQLAAPGDQAVAAGYARSSIRGPLTGGARLTILTERAAYKVGEEVRVIHVFEAPEPGHELRLAGPKPIRGEFVDGVDRATGPEAPYDGRVAPSPGADFQWEVTTYRFTAPGPHRIQWRTGGRASNVIAIEVTP